MTAPPGGIDAVSPRMLPQLTDANRDFWTGGATGRLLVPRCDQCRRWVLPPAATCDSCGGPATSEAVSGRARLFTWTMNAHQFHPEIPPPNLIAIVVLDEQEDLRLATNLVGCAEEDLRVGMPLEVEFERHDDLYYPVFHPAADQ